MLQAIGLSTEADLVYRAMLAHREWGVRSIAEHLNLTETQVRATLDALAGHGLLHNSGNGFRAVHPSAGLAGLLTKAEAEITARRHELEAARAAIAAIAAEHDYAGDRDFVTRLEGVMAVRDRIEVLAANAETECVSFNPNRSQTPDAKQASRPVNESMLARGVEIRCVYQESFRNDPEVLAYARWLTSLGGRTRTVPMVPMMIVIFDSHTALLPLDPDDSSKGAIEISSPAIVAAVHALFEQVWVHGTDFGDITAYQGDVDPSQRQLLQLLATGQTDEAAARALGVSVTTVRRTMAALMQRLNARSRFQAGVHASERGWLRH
ncbi:MAG TPA: LuxR C-terminal-related transcriptional regulator [Candidatus Limnocylindrales bacterium]